MEGGGGVVGDQSIVFAARYVPLIRLGFARRETVENSVRFW